MVSIAWPSATVAESPTPGSLRLSGSSSTEPLWPEASLTSSAVETLPSRSRRCTTLTWRGPAAAAAVFAPPSLPVYQR